MIANPSLMPEMIDFCVDNIDPCLLDVHCTVSSTIQINDTTLEFKCLGQCRSEENCIDSLADHYNFKVIQTRWDSTLKDVYSEEFNIEHISQLNERLDGSLQHKEIL